MSADLPIQLRLLTQEYHDGKLNLATYRSMRAALLDSLVAGVGTSAAAAAAVAATQPRAGTWRQADAVTRPGKLRATAAVLEPVSGLRDAQPGPSGTAPASLDVASRPRPASALPVRTIAIVVAVLLIAGLGFWLWHGHASSSADTSGAVPTAAEQDRVRDLLAQFTDRADWGDAHLAALNTDLLELGGSAAMWIAASGALRSSPTVTANAASGLLSAVSGVEASACCSFKR